MDTLSGKVAAKFTTKPTELLVYAESVKSSAMTRVANSINEFVNV